MATINEKAANEVNLRKKAYDKACEDTKFRSLLRDNPREAVRQLGVGFSEGTKIHVIEKEDNVVYLVLPSQTEMGARYGCGLECNMCSTLCTPYG